MKIFIITESVFKYLDSVSYADIIYKPRGILVKTTSSVNSELVQNRKTTII